MEIIILDGTKMTSFDELHDYIKRIMRLPGYYGRNLDALADCLSELGTHVTVILNNADALKEGMGVYGGRLISVFEDISSEPGSFNFILS